MIPEFESDGLLPKGIHETTWELFCARFGNSSRKRKELIKKIEVVLKILKEVGCQELYIDGSFVSRRNRPGDFDACWLRDGVDLSRLNQIAPILKHAPGVFKGVDCKQKYGGDIFQLSRLVPDPQNPNGRDITYLEFFQMDKESDQQKGIILLKLDTINLEESSDE
jgi:hypothetical protein